jgi:undecaprenyl-phosphate 4-deoxy-4-formamido-L-arabinose transferase
MFTCGIMMLMLGLIGEYLGRIYICINKSPQYVVRETVNVENDRNKQ